MKNLKISNNFKKGVKYKVKRSIATLGLLATLATTSLTGCSKNNTNDYDLKSVVEALHQDDNITNVDNNLLENNISKLDKKYQKAYNDNNIEKCNEIISEIGELVLKSMIAEGYNIEFDKINRFETLGLIDKKDADGKEKSATEYGVSFEYEGENYNIEAQDNVLSDNLARTLCVIVRAGKNNQLVSNRQETDFSYLYLPRSYEIIKEALMTKLNYKNKKHTNKYIYQEGYDIIYRFYAD